MEDHLCTKCGCDFEVLYGKGMYQGNLDRNFYCEKCYVVAFGGPFEITTIGEEDGKCSRLGEQKEQEATK